MTVHNVSELTGPLLDLAVAICEGYSFIPRNPKLLDEDNLPAKFVWAGIDSVYCSDIDDNGYHKHYSPSTCPAQGQPIAGRERIGCRFNGSWWVASHYFRSVDFATGNSELEARMRCYVISRCGFTIELPDIG